MLGSKYTLVIRNENNRRHKEKEINTDLVYVHFSFLLLLLLRAASFLYSFYYSMRSSGPLLLQQFSLRYMYGIRKYIRILTVAETNNCEQEIFLSID